MEYSGAGGKLIHEKNQKQKISRHCPFKLSGDCTKKAFLYIHECINFQTKYLKNEKSFFNQIFSESLYIHVLLAQQILAL